MRRFGILPMAALFGAALGGSALAATPAGKAVGVNPSANDVVATGTRTLVVGADVAMGDKIVTGESGQVQLIFNDDTHLVVGPNSALVIQSYLLRNDKSVSQFAVNSLSGTFRFITGKSDHSAYTINTPTGTIGVRGTAFDYTVGALHGHGPFLGGTTVALFRGAVVLCNLQQQCVVLDKKCEAGLIDPAQATRFNAFQAVDQHFRTRFQYIESQAPLMPPFRIDESRFCFLDLGGSPNGGSSTEGGGPNTPRKGGLR